MSQNQDLNLIQDKKKSLFLSVGLNLVLPGAGYIYCHRIRQALLAWLVIVLFIFTIPLIWLPEVIGGLVLVLALDGAWVAQKYNKELDKKIASLMKTCPHCFEKVHPSAKVCKYCRHQFEA